MRVLVTGGTGFIGSHTARALSAAGHAVRLLARDEAKLGRVIRELELSIEDFTIGDVTDAGAVERALDGCDAVVHSAAIVALEASRAREVLGTNARGVELVVGGAVERGMRSIVYVSSASALFTPGAGPITASSPLAAWKSAYALSKADSERFVRRLQDAGAPIRSTYPCGVIGPDDPGISEGNHTIRTFLRDLMVITSSGFQVIDVRDLADLHATLVDPDAPTGRYVAGAPMLEWASVVALMDELTGRRVRRVPCPGGLLRALGRVGDAVKRVRPFDFPLTGESMDHATQWPGAVVAPELETLGVCLRDVRETYADTIRWLYRAGHLNREQAGRLADA
jgi:nucleoside-diphosphate-sugar epimerase